jgi:hypothetical protein
LLTQIKKIKKVGAAVEYMQKIDEKLYSRQAFALPWLGKMTTNPAEQANFGLLGIRKFAPLKLFVALWDYMQLNFNGRRLAANSRSEFLSKTADCRHILHHRSFGQLMVANDGKDRAKVSTTDGQYEYAVTLFPYATCTCIKFLEMLWPYQHVMAWDDIENKDFMRHFHKCWNTEIYKVVID